MVSSGGTKFQVLLSVRCAVHDASHARAHLVDEVDLIVSVHDLWTFVNQV